MSTANIIRAWKDADYRSTLSQDELAKLPANPAGTSDLSDDELASIYGGLARTHPNSLFCIPPLVSRLIAM